MDSLKLIPYQNERTGLFGYVNADTNKVVIAAVYEEAKPFIDEYAIVKYKGFYGVIDKDNQKVLNNIYSQIVIINNESFHVSLGGKTFFLNNSGKQIFDPALSEAEILDELKKDPYSYKKIGLDKLADQEFVKNCYSAISDGLLTKNDYYHPELKFKYGFQDYLTVHEGFKTRITAAKERAQRNQVVTNSPTK